MLSKEGDRRSTRTRLLASAYDLLVEEGYQATVLAAINRGLAPRRPRPSDPSRPIRDVTVDGWT